MVWQASGLWERRFLCRGSAGAFRCRWQRRLAFGMRRGAGGRARYNPAQGTQTAAIGAPGKKQKKTSAAPSKAMSMVLEASEREIIEGCRRGERDAFRALFETYKNRVYSVALRFSGDEATASDIAQSTF